MALDLDERQRAMLLEMGVRVWAPQLPVGAPVLPSGVTGAPSPAAARPAPMPAPFALSAEGLNWSALALASANCRACGLCAGRKNSTLRGETMDGPRHWMLVGDPPDEEEDRLGQPFAGAPGVLLDNMLKAMGASRNGTGSQGAYLTNVVKCRAPQGRLVGDEELAQCASYLRREVALVQPQVILAMGRFATQVLLADYPEQARLPLGKLRGSVFRYCGVPVVATYHPLVLLRSGADKAKAWADLCLALQVASLQ
jgi:DNA polymerase